MSHLDIQNWGSESMFSRGGGSTPPQKKALKNRYRVKCVIIAQFFKGSSLEKNRSITFIVWVLGRVEKNPKTVKKKFVLVKTNIVFRSL